jgi:preprotein translocase subunit SecA
MGTGEGKSFVLAVTAFIFALAGYESNIVCYSENLVERDRKNF